MTDWRFDEADSSNAWFNEDVQGFLPSVWPAVERALIEILETPLANPQAVIRGEVVYIKRLNPALVDGELVPALLLAYTVAQRERIVRKLALCRAADVAPGGATSSDEQIRRALQRLVETAIRRASQRNH